MALHPEHLADLRRSGLSDETISALEIHSARPGDIPRLIGWNPKEVTSVLVFPYPGEAGFYRVNVFPAFVDKNGRKVKYLQRSGTGVRLYVPPLATRHLTNPYEPLAWTEGEKKAARACQEGIACIGLGGLWNWMEDKKPIPKLDEVAHVGRKELIYGDTDVWIRPDLQRAIYAFGMALEARGAKVEFVILPPGLNGEKQGLDDFLVEKGKEELKELRRINLKDKAFSQTKEWYQDWIKSRDIISEPIKAPDPMSESERDEALALLKDPRFLARFLDAIEKVGCVGEEENKLALYMTFTSRLLCQPINNVVKGESAAGKNFLVSAVGRFFPPEDVKFISSATEKAFYYLPEDLSHKVVVIAERHGAEDADYSIRTFQSEGNLIILVPEKDDNGRIVTRERVVKGPAAFIETTTRPHLHPENETRTFDLFLDESEKQTEAIFDAQDRRYLGQGTDADGRLVIWRNAQRLLKVTPVTIPYVTAIRFPPKPLRVRRDRLRVLAMIEACTILHQFQRERKEVNECAYLVASLDDYAIVRELANKMLGPALKGATPKCEELVSQASAFGELHFTRAEIEKEMGWDRKTVSKYLKEAVGLGCIDETPEGKGKASRYLFVKKVSQVGGLLLTVEELEDRLSKLSIPGEIPFGQVNSSAIKGNGPGCPVVQGEEIEARCDTQGVSKEKQLSVVQVEPHTPNVPECPGCGFVQPKATGDTYIACQCGKVYGHSRSRS